MSQLLVMCSGEKVNKLQKKKLHDQKNFFRENTYYEKIYIFMIQVFAIKSGLLDKKKSAKCRYRVSP